MKADKVKLAAILVTTAMMTLTPLHKSAAGGVAVPTLEEGHAQSKPHHVRKRTNKGENGDRIDYIRSKPTVVPPRVQ